MLCTENQRREDCREKLFRFESFWLSNEKCKEVVAEARQLPVNSVVHAKLETCENSLQDWVAKEFSEIKSMIKSKEAC